MTNLFLISLIIKHLSTIIMKALMNDYLNRTQYIITELGPTHAA